MTPLDTLREMLANLPNVIQRPSRFGSRTNEAWTVDGKEFAHLHSESLIDLRLPRPLQKSLRDNAKAHARPSASDWIELEFHTARDVEYVASLVHEAWKAAKSFARKS